MSQPPLLSRWDMIVFGALEALAIALVVFVPAGSQWWAFLAGVGVLAAAGAAFLRLAPAGRRMAATRPSAAMTAPWWVILGGCVVTMTGALVVFRLLGGGDSFGWIAIAMGIWLPVSRATDRWWTLRADASAV
jgi:hypothetical protein